MKKTTLLSGVFLVVLIVFGALAVGIYVLLNPYISKEVYIQYPYEGDARMWEHIFGYAEGEDVYAFESKPLGVVIPHHILVADEMAKFYSAVAEVYQPSTIVVFGPNHFENAPETHIQTCLNCVFTTPSDIVPLENKLIDDLIDEGIAVAIDETFLQEHAIFAHTPFIQKFFPKADIVPILTQWEIPLDEADALAAWLDENLPEDALVIGSIDFSHDQPATVADFHDLSTYATIKNFDLKNVYDLEIDSPTSLYVLMNVMRNRGYVNVQRFAHTNSQDYASEFKQLTTSHQFFGFFEGEMEKTEGVSFLSFGNVVDDFPFGFVEDWNWNRTYDEQTDLTDGKFLRDIRGKEDRFLSGTDFLVFDLPEGECFEKKQNDMDVTFCKFSEIIPASDEKVVESVFMTEDSKDMLRQHAAVSDIVYVLYEFEGGELDKEKKGALQDLVKLGADVVVARGAVAEDGAFFDYYKGGLVFYSLGDFLTDSKLLNELTAESSGVVSGLYVTPSEYLIYPFFVDVVNGYPVLSDHSKFTQLFARFLEKSAVSPTAEIDMDKGMLKIKR